MISQERLKIEVKLLLSASSKSYMPRGLAQQRMTLSDLEWPFHASRAIFRVDELLVLIFSTYYVYFSCNCCDMLVAFGPSLLRSTTIIMVDLIIIIYTFPSP